jgi:broad specificity phosphatase PhoE
VLYLLRHGQTAANAAGEIQGQRDPELNQLGRRQAAAAARLLPSGAAVVTSPLLRARQTAEALAGCGAPTVDRRWMEMDFGDFEGRLVADVREVMWAGWRDDVDWAPGGGESLAAVSRRVREACSALVPHAAAEDVIVVTHVTPIKVAVAWALDVEPTIAGRTFVAEASITTIAVNADGVPILRSFGLGPIDP